MGTVLEEEEDEGIVNDGQEESDVAVDDSQSIPGDINICSVYEFYAVCIQLFH